MRDPKTRRFKELRIHDCRCSAAINLVDAGVPQDAAKKIGAWKTDAMFSRYNAVDKNRIREAMEKSGQYVAERIKQAK